jgi:hypothetical protein
MFHGLPDQCMNIHFSYFQFKILLINLGHMQDLFNLLQHPLVFLPDDPDKPFDLAFIRDHFGAGNRVRRQRNSGNRRFKLMCHIVDKIRFHF